MWETISTKVGIICQELFKWKTKKKREERQTNTFFGNSLQKEPVVSKSILNELLYTKT